MMDKNYKIEKIVRLIVAEMQGTISEEDRAVLNRWLEESGENRALYFRWKDEQYVEQKLAALCRTDFRAPAKRMEYRIKMAKKQLRIRKIRRFSVAASVLLAGLVSWVVWTQKAQDVQPEPHRAKQQVVLTLSDGRSIEIGSSKETIQYKDAETNINASWTQLSYAPDTIEGQAADKEEKFNELFVPRGSEYCLELSDHTKVWLNAGTRLRYPVAFTGKTRTVYLDGEAYFEVQKSAGKRFVVMSGKHTVNVLGTKFNIMAYDDETTVQTTLTQGKVAVETGGRSMELSPGEQTVYDRHSGEVSKSEVDVSRILAWREGYIVFDGLPLKRILQILTRWYDVEFAINDSRLENMVFQGGVYRYEELRKVLDVLEETGEVKFRNVNARHIEVEFLN